MLAAKYFGFESFGTAVAVFTLMFVAAGFLLLLFLYIPIAAENKKRKRKLESLKEEQVIQEAINIQTNNENIEFNFSSNDKEDVLMGNGEKGDADE